MGGKDASRGFLYQAFAAVLEALCQQTWDKIYIEMDSKYDKVDIALEKNAAIFKSIQVKSTINSFSKKNIIRWLKDLIEDEVGSIEFDLFLIGQCDQAAITFINSVKKFQNCTMDSTSQQSLNNFDTSIVQDKSIKFTDRKSVV